MAVAVLHLQNVFGVFVHMSKSLLLVGLHRLQIGRNSQQPWINSTAYIVLVDSFVQIWFQESSSFQRGRAKWRRHITYSRNLSALPFNCRDALRSSQLTRSPWFLIRALIHAAEVEVEFNFNLAMTFRKQLDILDVGWSKCETQPS